MTLTWTQPPETVSHTQTQMRCLYELPQEVLEEGTGFL